MFCVLCGHGHMTYMDMAQECPQNNCLPVLVMAMGKDESPIVPVFETQKTAARFIERNLPSDWTCGVIELSMNNAEWMDSNGWRALKFDFPRKLNGFIKFDVLVMECEGGVVVQKKCRSSV